jgi:hypothetical protein
MQPQAGNAVLNGTCRRLALFRCGIGRQDVKRAQAVCRTVAW